MTRYERTKQLETRKSIAAGFALLGIMLAGFVFLLKLSPCTVDASIDERPVIVQPYEEEVEPIEPAFTDFIDCEEVNAVEDDERGN